MSSYYTSWNNRRNAWIASQIGPMPDPPIYWEGELIADNPAYYEWKRRSDQLQAQYVDYLRTVDPAGAAEAEAAFTAHSAGIDRVNKIGKIAALGVIGVSGAGAALTAAGVIGTPAVAAGAGEAAGLETAIAASASGDAAIAGTAATAGTTAATVGGGGLSAAGLLSSLGGVGGLISAGLGVAGAVIGAKGARDQAEEDQATALYNAQEAEFAAKNALLRGEEDARDLRRRGSLVEGNQRATFAARGLDLTAGTPKDAIEQTRFFTDQDMATARSNAATEAATYRRQGSRFQSAAANINPSRTGGLSLVSNLATVAARWYDRNGG